MRHLIALVAALAVAGPALACVNYSETSNHEREFRSQYQESQYQPPAAEPVTSNRPYVLGGVGVAMAAAGAFMLARLRRPA
jgi:hypothetical protein